MNVYFEIADAVIDQVGCKYLALYNVRKSAVIGDTSRQLLLYSNRVWTESEEGVRYLKNRYEDIYDTHGVNIDMKEFFWIKLQSQTYEQSLV
jgi:hypothetical protein